MFLIPEDCVQILEKRYVDFFRLFYKRKCLHTSHNFNALNFGAKSQHRSAGEI